MSNDPERIDRIALDAAIEEAQSGWDEGGIPIGAALVDRDGTIVARGRNRRVQDGDPTAHGEISCLRAAGRRRDWRSLVLATTLSPCPMCSGALVLFRVGRVVIGENRTFQGAERWLRDAGIETRVVDDERCIALMSAMQEQRADLWAEDIGDP